MIHMVTDTPMYIRLEAILEEAINSGQYDAEDKFPWNQKSTLQYWRTRICIDLLQVNRRVYFPEKMVLRHHAFRIHYFYHAAI